MCTRNSNRTLLGGPSTSPLDVVMWRLGFVLLTGALTLAACASNPWSYSYVHFTPTVTGHLYMNGAPVAGAEISVLPGQHSPCGSFSLDDRTSPNGSFHVWYADKKVWNERNRKSLGELPWQFCIRYNHAWVLGYAEDHFGSEPRTVHLRCDLADQPVIDPRNAHSDRPGVCLRDDVGPDLPAVRLHP